MCLDRVKQTLHGNLLLSGKTDQFQSLQLRSISAGRRHMVVSHVQAQIPTDTQQAAAS